MHQRFVIFLMVAIGLIGCKKPGETAFQKQVGIPQSQWRYDFQPTFKFAIPDTSSRYKVYIILRHDEQFPNSNIWIRLKTKGAGGKSFSLGQRVECPLAAPDGQWLGNGLGSIWEHRILLKEGRDYPKFSKPGLYEFKLEQIMRINPLPSVLNIGLRVERLDVK